jgi:hypothetical protein
MQGRLISHKIKINYEFDLWMPYLKNN